MNEKEKIIFAPATLIGESSISVVRISGKNSFDAARKIFSSSKKEFKPVDIPPDAIHSLKHGYVMDHGELVDEAVCSFFRNPHSFTGEDVVEISSHGGVFVYRAISDLLAGLGCIPAEPGEFSKRAFLNGKMDLTQAEAISDLIRAKSEMASKAALKQLSGNVSQYINNLKAGLINYCSLVELELDFADEGLDLIPKEKLLSGLNRIIGITQKFAISYESGRIIKNGVNLAIIGKPNAGKSSIFNYLLNDSRAIVSHIPGTTRDYLEESLLLGGIAFNLIDTAGIRHSTDEIEKEGVRRSLQKMDEADLVLEVIDLTNEESKEPVNSKSDLIVYNKADAAEYKESQFAVSALTGFNMKELEDKLVEKANKLIDTGEKTEAIITNERHKIQLLKSCEYLVNAKKLVEKGSGNELISIEIREALSSLEEIIGKTTNVDILNNIFTKFCIGK
jgi:tRNA modification GTPase